MSQILNAKITKAHKIITKRKKYAIARLDRTSGMICSGDGKTTEKIHDFNILDCATS